MEEQQPDDIPMMDAPEPVPTANSSTQRFSIVDVLSGSTPGIGKEAIGSMLPNPMHSDLYEFDETKVIQRLQEIYPHTDIQKLPRYWNKNDRWTNQIPQNNNVAANQTPVLELSTDFLRVTKHKGITNNNSNNQTKDAAAVRANRPIPRSSIVYYFEITVVSKGMDGRYMGVGLSEKNVSLNRLPGWDQISYGYHGDDGNFFASSGKGVEYGPTFATGDIIGCGLNFVTREIFFTKNGQHLGVANSQPIPLNNDLYPTVGMQTPDEMVGSDDPWGWMEEQTLSQIDANFGQKPFAFDIHSELQAAEAATINSVAAMELPCEKVLWMNSLVSNWMAHEGYSRPMDALNCATGGTKLEPIPALAKSESQASASTSIASKDSQSPTTAAEKVAETVMRSMLGLLGAGGAGELGVGGRRSVVRSVQEALHEEMEQRRLVLRMVKRGQLAEAIERLEQLYPNLLDSNRQLALLLKTQQFIEMLRELSRELPPLPQEQQELLPPSSSTPRTQFAHSPSPRPCSSRAGKRSASAVVDEEDEGAGTSGGRGSGGFTMQHNPVKRRSSDEECQPERVCFSSANQLQQHANGSSATPMQQQFMQQQAQDEFMEISEESQDGQVAGLVLDSVTTANGRSNGCACSSTSLLVGTPPTSTTIIDEPSAEILEPVDTDGFLMEMGEEQEEPDCGSFTNAEEQSQFERYEVILKFGQQISQFSFNLDEEDGHPQNCASLRQRMNEAFSLLCYRDPSQSDHAYLLEQCQRDLVAKALNSAILESHGKEGISPLDKCLRRARLIRDQALVFSASSFFADANRLLFEHPPAASPSHVGGQEQMSGCESMAESLKEGQGKATPRGASSIHRHLDAQKKEM